MIGSGLSDKIPASSVVHEITEVQSSTSMVLLDLFLKLCYFTPLALWVFHLYG